MENKKPGDDLFDRLNVNFIIIWLFYYFYDFDSDFAVGSEIHC